MRVVCDKVVQHLPRQTKVDAMPATQSVGPGGCRQVHAKCRGAAGDRRAPTMPPASATRKRRWMSPSSMPACRWMSPRARPATESEGGCRQVRLPRQWTIDVAKSHACHTKCPGVTGGDQARHRTQPSATTAMPRLPRKRKVDVTKCPRLPRKTKVDVTKCHACKAK